MIKKFFLIFIAISILCNPLLSKDKIYKIASIIYAKPFMASLKGFKDGLKSIGYKKIKFYTFNINTNLKKIPEVLNKIYNLNVNLIFATTTPVNLALKKLLKKNIPVIFNEVADPVGCGLVKSLKSSKNNFTGVSHVAFTLLPKRLEIFKDMFPNIKNVDTFVNPHEQFLNKQVILLEKYKSYFNVNIIPLYVTNREEILYILKNKKFNNETDGIFMSAFALPMANVDLLIRISHKNRIPLMVIDNIVLSKGGCVGYSPDFYSVGFQSAFIADKIFKGANPSNIPIEYPEKINLIINMKELKKTGIDYNRNYLIFANEIIK